MKNGKRQTANGKPVCGALALVVFFAPLGASAQALPDARAVLARYVAATGAAKLVTAPGLHITGTFEVAAQGLRGTIEAWHDIPSGRTMQVLTLAGLGEIRTGSDSTFAWSMTPYEGPKILEVAEFVRQREKEDLRAMRRDPSVVLEASVIERTTADGQPCFNVKLKWKSGRETVECYSEATGMLVRSEAVETTSAGSIPTTYIFSEYKTFGVMTMATKTVQRATGIEITQRIINASVEPVDPAKVTPPPEILALRKR